MDVNYLYSNVFVFLLMSKNKKTENSVKIYATLVKLNIFQIIEVYILDTHSDFRYCQYFCVNDDSPIQGNSSPVYSIVLFRSVDFF